MKRRVVYVAGPYTTPDPEDNTRRALLAATALLDSGLVIPYVPHLSFFWDALTPRPYEVWLELDLEIIERCDALLRLPGHSPGADREMAHARQLRKPTFTNVSGVLDWASPQPAEIAGQLSVDDVLGGEA